MFTLIEKLKILADGASNDKTCSSLERETNSLAMPYGVCRSFTMDGRCISLLRILYTNECAYNCCYCDCKRELDIARATFSPQEVCKLTVEFWEKKYIDGLFLSSAVYKNPNYTMELLTQTVIMLRKLYNFGGYIHLKAIPSSDVNLLHRVAKYVDRMSLNIELPSEKSLRLLAPQKSKNAIITPMKSLAERYKTEKNDKYLKKKILPSGQTTQMIVGASDESDGKILALSAYLYNKFELKRVYYSAFKSNKYNQNSLLPSKSTEQMREVRLYQADLLMRNYGFHHSELISQDENLPLDIDPKCNWAIKNPQHFPIDINTAPLEMLIRTPGISLEGANDILRARKTKTLDFKDLAKMQINLQQAKHFIITKGKFEGISEVERLRHLLRTNAQPISLEN